MCFGDKKTETTTQELPAWLTPTGQQNLNFAQKLPTQGFTPYSGEQVAPFSGQQQQSFTGGADLSKSINGGPIGSLVNNYATAGPQSVTADTISSRMSPYMNQYVNMALTPQLQMQDLQFAAQNKGADAQATSSGAYGDTGWGQLRGTMTNAQDAARTGLVGNAYNAAFNTAIGAGAQDVSNKLNADTTSANFAETALGRQLTGANTMNAMQTGAVNLNNQLGAQQTAQQQAQLNARYNQWMMSQQYPFQTTQLLNQSIGAGRTASPMTTTKTAPDNTGWGILGALAPIAAAPFTGGLSFAGLGGMGGERADGGPVEPGKPYVGGERGPEVVVPNTTGVVIPHEVLEAARAARSRAPPIKYSIAA